ncbi:acetoin dehydrogenase dihydrolipoyllysine-residue acetyltransferase subunit [Coralliovum pocilloporae]|uniref:acetoin dehydrogenase dihydrolipoyllysine-residue acetyltransferase subunit n=1 Tax=Coralliovum pocilloporae TaxID=3066369 RepID=UPI003306B727
MTSDITPIVMPKWGLAMQEGDLTTWLVEDGSQVEQGTEIAEIETTKIANVFEASITGTIHHVAQIGETLPVGALIAVMSAEGTNTDEIKAFITEFQSNFVPEETDSDTGPEPKRLSVGEIELSYLDVGPDDGDAIFLIHGFGADSNGWLFNQTALSEHMRTISVDLPGHGKSSKRVGEGSIQGLAQIISQMLDELNLQRVHLVGHSLGGGIALALAERADVTSLSLIAPAGVGAEINGDFLNGFLTAKRRKALQPVLQLLVADPELIGREMVEDVLKLKRLDGVPEALQTLIDANFQGNRQQHDLRPSLSLKPTLVLWGEKDAIIPSSQALQMPEECTVKLIPDAGHIPQMEASNDINDAILDHVKATNQ